MSAVVYRLVGRIFPLEVFMRLAMVRFVFISLLVAGLEPAFGGTIKLTSGSIDYADVLVGDGRSIWW